MSATKCGEKKGESSQGEKDGVLNCTNKISLRMEKFESFGEINNVHLGHFHLNFIFVRQIR